METNFEDPMFSEFSSDALSPMPMGPKAIQHHFVTSHHHHHPHHHHHHHHQQAIMLGNGNGELNQHQRLPDVHQILPGNSPKMEHYKSTTTTQSIDYGHVKIEQQQQQQYSPSGKIEFINGSATSKLESYSPSSSAGNGSGKLEYTTNGQYSPNAKIIEYTTGAMSVPGVVTTTTQHIEHIQMFQQPQSLDHQQQHQHNIINGSDGNFKRKSDENLNNLSGSPTPTTLTSISSNDGNSAGTSILSSPNKKPIDKKKNDANGIKKKKTRYVEKSKYTHLCVCASTFFASFHYIQYHS